LINKYMRKKKDGNDLTIIRSMLISYVKKKKTVKRKITA